MPFEAPQSLFISDGGRGRQARENLYTPVRLLITTTGRYLFDVIVALGVPCRETPCSLLPFLLLLLLLLPPLPAITGLRETFLTPLRDFSDDFETRSGAIIARGCYSFRPLIASSGVNGSVTSTHHYERNYSQKRAAARW